MSYPARRSLLRPDPFLPLLGSLRGSDRPDEQPVSADVDVAPRVPARYARQDALTALCSCMAELGRVPTRRDYEQWRVQRAVAAPGSPATQLTTFPSTITISRLLGSWDAAKTAAGF